MYFFYNVFELGLNKEEKSISRSQINIRGRKLEVNCFQMWQ